MHKKRRKDSTCVIKKNGKIVGYITRKDEEKGLDIKLNTQGYEIIAL
ncbi:hypothetical protein ACMHYK_10310 [Candidatus Enterenecus avicola]